MQFWMHFVNCVYLICSTMWALNLLLVLSVFQYMCFNFQLKIFFIRYYHTTNSAMKQKTQQPKPSTVTRKGKAKSLLIITCLLLIGCSKPSGRLWNRSTGCYKRMKYELEWIMLLCMFLFIKGIHMMLLKKCCQPSMALIWTKASWIIQKKELHLLCFSQTLFNQQWEEKDKDSLF